MNNVKVLAMIRRCTPAFAPDSYWYCGYVGVTRDAARQLPPAVNERCYSKSLESMIDVPGGITFSGEFTDITDIIPISDIPANYYNYHWYGFDLNKSYHHKSGISTNFDYCKSKVLIFKNQIENLLNELHIQYGY